MRRAWLIAGIVVLLLGVVLLLDGILVNTPQTTSGLDAATSAWTFDPSGLTQRTATVQWSAGSPSSEVYLLIDNYPAFGLSCGGGGQLVSEGSGSSGSFSAGVIPGDTYLLYACNGSSPATLPVTLTVSGGITLDELLSAPVIVAGVVLVFVGITGRSASREEADRVLGPRPPQVPT